MKRPESHARKSAGSWGRELGELALLYAYYSNLLIGLWPLQKDILSRSHIELKSLSNELKTTF